VVVGLQSVLVITPGGASPRTNKECDVFCVEGADFRLFRPVRENRRNWGVNRVKQGRAPKKILKILLTENARCTILPFAPVTAFPPEVRSDVPLLSARRTKSAKEYRCPYN
jgi:hypothetical protein